MSKIAKNLYARSPRVSWIFELTLGLLIVGITACSKTPPPPDPPRWNGANFVIGSIDLEDDLDLYVDVFLSPILIDPTKKANVRVVAVTLNYAIGMEVFTRTRFSRVVEPTGDEVLTARMSAHPSSVEPSLGDRLYSVAIGPIPGVTWADLERFDQLIVEILPLQE